MGYFSTPVQMTTIDTKNGIITVKCYRIIENERFLILIQSNLKELIDWQLISQHKRNIEILKKWILNTINEKMDNCSYTLQFKVKVFDPTFLSYFNDCNFVNKNVSLVQPQLGNLIMKVSKCKYLPGPLDGHIYNYDPAVELMYNYGKRIDYVFDVYKRRFKKTYIKGTAEHYRRKIQFCENLRFIYWTNRANLGFTVGINQFADFFDEEFKAYAGCKRPKRRREYYKNMPLECLPKSIDWRITGAVMTIKNQRSNACWTFSIIDNMKNIFFLNYDELIKFSEQNFIGCTQVRGKFGAYLMNNSSTMATVTNYGQFLVQDSASDAYKVPSGNLIKTSGYFDIPTIDKDALKITFVKYNSVSVTVVFISNLQTILERRLLQ